MTIYDPATDELDWLAFRYVTGELSHEESAAFEERLGSDLSACEAVARAVELTRAVAAMPPNAWRGGERRRWATAGAWIAAAAAASIVAAIIGNARQADDRERRPPTVASVWAKSIRHISLDSRDPELLVDSDDRYNQLLEEPEFAVPVWLMEAVDSSESADGDGNWEDS